MDPGWWLHHLPHLHCSLALWLLCGTALQIHQDLRPLALLLLGISGSQPLTCAHVPSPACLVSLFIPSSKFLRETGMVVSSCSHSHTLQTCTYLCASFLCAVSLCPARSHPLLPENTTPAIARSGSGSRATPAAGDSVLCRSPSLQTQLSERPLSPPRLLSLRPSCRTSGQRGTYFLSPTLQSGLRHYHPTEHGLAKFTSCFLIAKCSG